MSEPHPQRAANLDDAERSEVEQRKPPRAAVLHETVGRTGEEELRRTVSSLAWSGLAAGLSMGFSMIASGALQAYLPDVLFAHLITALGYCTGFVIVIMARQQLFTENTLTAVLPLMSAPGLAKLGALLRLWSIVLIGNLAGVVAFAYGVARLPLFDEGMMRAFAAMGGEIMAYSAAEMFVKAILGGWIIAMMVWLMAAVDAARLWVIIGLTWLIAAAGLVHVIGSAAEVFFLVFDGRAGWGEALGRFLGPVLAGNIVGGSLIFAMISHAQVRGEI
ncbi:MAG TPA: formate/nitrite transporter family protein [Rhodanobacteraceae bacterium]|nr:formate/nitrite transporter family protein [Rhodanobacteraceae bacterium]